VQSQRGHGQTLTWTGASSNLWSLAGSDANWSNSVGSPAAYTDYSNTEFGSSASNTFINVVQTVNPSSMTFDNGATPYSFSGASISGTGSVTLANDAGSVSFNSANSYTGPTIISSAPYYGGGSATIAGTLTLGNALAAQNSTIIVDSPGGTVFYNATLDSGLAFAPYISPSIGGLSGSGDISLTDGLGNPVTLTVGGNNASTVYSGQLVGTLTALNGALTKIGTGNLTLLGDNAFTGPTTISGGTLQLGDGATEVQLSGNVWECGSLVGPIVNNATLVVANPLLVNLPAVSGTGGLVKSGSATLVVATPQSYTGPTLLSAGVLQLAPTAVSGFGNGGTGWSSPDPSFMLTGNTLQMTRVKPSGGSLWYTSYVTPVNGFALSFTYSASIAGNNSNTGGGYVDVILQNSPSQLLAELNKIVPTIDSVGINLGCNNSVAQTAYFSNNTTGMETNLPNPNFFLSGDPINVAVNYNPATNTLAWSFTDPNTTTTYSYSQSNLNLASLLGGSNAYVGFIGGNGNPYMAQQITNFSYTQSANYNNFLPAGSAMILTGSATLDMDGNSETVGSLSGAGTVTNGMAGTVSTLTVSETVSSTFGGTISDGNGETALTVSAGSLTLSGSNAYSGGTCVEGNGTLILTNDEAIEDGTSLYVGSDLSAFGGAIPAGAAAAPATVAPVPEPGTPALAAVAVCGALAVRRLRRRARSSRLE
jgi:fibronectin-binding autotransporter adhesin